eukprot:1141912-Pelagomonas_calceolata.AAC.1
MSMKLPSKPDGCVSVKTKLFKRLQSGGGRGAVAWRPQAGSWAGRLHSIRPPRDGRASVLEGAD